MKYLFLVIAVVLSGCSTMFPQTTESIAKYVDGYCLAADEIVRESMRLEINNLTQIGDVKITCEGDI